MLKNEPTRERIPLFDLIASDQGLELLAIYLLLEFLKVQLLIQVNLICLSGFVLELHNSCIVIIYDDISIGNAFILFLLEYCDLFEFITHY